MKKNKNDKRKKTSESKGLRRITLKVEFSKAEKAHLEGLRFWEKHGKDSDIRLGGPF